MAEGIKVIAAGEQKNFTVNKQEVELIEKVKAKQDSEALTVLVNSNTGIYLDVVNRYAAAYPNTIRKSDLTDDKMFNIYKFILDYDPSKGSKLSTYVSNRTHWLCKTLLKQDRENPVKSGTYGPSGAMNIDFMTEQFYGMTQQDSIVLADESKEAQVVEEADKDLKIEEVVAAAWRVCTDSRFVSILNYRHFNDGTKTSLSWREIGDLMGLSHEACRKIYNTNIALVKTHIADRAA